MSINIRKAYHIGDYNSLICLLKDYIDELSSCYSCVDKRDESQLADEYFYTPDTDFFIISVNDSDIGFAIIGYNSNCHKDVDAYIEDFYISPDYRRRGFGSYFACEILKDYSSLCFFVIRKNLIAQNFWNRVFQEFRNLSHEILDYTETTDEFVWNVYKRNYK